MTDQPNILLIIMDQHSPAFMACAGDALVRTPALDRLAREGVRFSNAYCANPLCVPSRMTFLTSRSSSDIRVWTNRCRLRSDIATFVHHLVNAGYRATLCGRMHFVGPDQRHGFERRIIGDVDPKLEHIPLSTTGQNASAVENAGPGRTAYQRYDEEVTRVCCTFLESMDRTPPDKPFFLTVGYVLPHCPFICPKGLFEEYYEQVEAPRIPKGYVESLHPAMRRWRHRRRVDGLTDEQVRIARAACYGLVTMTDMFVGQVITTLEQTQFADNTLVVYTTDHGEMASEHRMWWKSSFYENSVRVPLIFHYPQQFSKGRSIHALCSLLDVGPTLVDYAGGQPMPGVRGESMRPLLEGAAHPRNASRVVFAEFGSLSMDPPARMVRTGPWKLSHFHGYELPQLFDLDADPGEWNDLGADQAHSDVREDLLAIALEGWSGEYVRESVDRLNSDAEVLRKFNARAEMSHSDPPDRWTAPDGCNIFPEVTP